MKIGLPKEIFTGERRVAGTPATVKKLRAAGFEVLVENGAGAAAGYLDLDYQSAGAVIADAATVWGMSDIVTKVRPPQATEQGHEADRLKSGATLISFIWPADAGDLLKRLGARQATVFGMEQVPRISRAQKLDALSSMANLTGYRAVIEAAAAYGSPFTGQITAAGRIPAATVLVIGAGVAGLAALGAARGLGAIVRAFDTRPAAKEQVESMGAEFLMLNFKEDGTGQGGYGKTMSAEFIAAEMALFAAQAKEVNIIITTALIPGRPAPKLLTAETVRLMRPGSVVVDMAAEQGGNCELTIPGKVIVSHGVTVIGYTDLPSRMALQASQLYGTNIVHFLDVLCPKGTYALNLQDEILRGSLILNQGTPCWPPPTLVTTPVKPQEKLGVALPSGVAPGTSAPAAKSHGGGKGTGLSSLTVAVLLAGIVVLGTVTPGAFLSHFTVFVLACFVGWQVVWSVKPALHTPLMSVTNAISGIIVIGAMLQLSSDLSTPSTWLAALAVLLAMINVAGGFLVTQRMLKMFQK